MSSSKPETVFIDGSIGEGGGQVLRTSLTLSCITGKRLHIENIRANRPKPGLGKQHVVCAEAAKEVCGARCSGTSIGSMTLDFEPGTVRSGNFYFDIGSAGSASLVMQTILPVLFTADKQSIVTVTGGTHNTWAPPFDFIRDSFLPAIAMAGFKSDCRLMQYGFYPAGGGKIVFDIQPCCNNSGDSIDLYEPIKEAKISAKIYTSKLPVQIADKQRKLLLCSGLNIETIEHIDVTDSISAGNCIAIGIAGNNRRIIFTGFGAKGKPSEKVINEVTTEARDFLNSDAAIDHYLADQLLIYMAIRKKGRFTTNLLSKHLTTNIEVIKKFLPADFAIEEGKNFYKVCCI
jgi:RNA 3'-terminal phosphate cyclase (ATP)